METEKRDLTEEEKAEVATLKREKTFLTMRMESTLPTAISGENKKEAWKNGLRSIAAEGKAMELQVRAEGTVSTASQLMTTGDVKTGGLFPVTIQEILMPLEEELIYNKVGIRMPTGCRGSYEWPVVEAVEATIADEGVEIEEKKINLSKVATVTQRIAVKVSATRESLYNSDGKLEGIIKELLPKAIASKINLILVSREKVTANCAITGPFVGMTATEVSPTFKALNKEKAKLLAKGVSSQRMCWVMTEATKAELEATPKDAGSGIMVVENDKMCGLPIFCHSAIGEGYIGLGDFTFQVAGQFGDIYLIVDPYTGAGSNSVKFTLNTDFGTAKLRPEAFALLKIKQS